MSRYKLQSGEMGLRLVDSFSHQHPLHIDFSGPAFSYRLRRGGGQKEMLARAVGIHAGMHVVDCTAGLGRDSFLLAHLGCNVTMIERSRIIGLLLQDAITRANHLPELEATCQRLSMVCGDAGTFLKHFTGNIDAIVIDPMFPHRKKQASVKGEMQFLQRFIGKDEDADTLLVAALSTGCSRIVLKRPIRSDVSVEPPPSFSHKGKSSRFDVFLQ